MSNHKINDDTPKWAWKNGELVRWEDATVHVRTEGFMRGATAFEGVRAYTDNSGLMRLFVFRGDDHLDRLVNTSMRILRMKIQWSVEELSRAIIELLQANNVHQDVHIRPQAYFGMGPAHGVDPETIGTGCVITYVARPSSGLLSSGINARVSSWRRIDDQVMPPRVKAGANYLNGRYATVEANVDGYDDAILLNNNGKVAEGPGACLLMARRGEVVTPPATSGSLESITRDTLMTLFMDATGEAIIERDIDRTELYTADELIFCGTGHEVQPIVSVDRYEIGAGSPGPICEVLQKAYFGVVRGDNSRYAHWLSSVYD